MRRIRGIVWVLLLLLASAVGCSDDAPADTGGAPTTAPSKATPAPTTTDPTATDPTRSSVVPGREWATIEPTAAGFDVAALEALSARAEAASSSCLVVVRDGKVVLDRSWPSPEAAPREAFSVTKSLTSTLVGIAADQGLLRLDDPASTYIPSWAGTPSADVTIVDLLSNSSGRHWDLATDYAAMAIRARDKTQLAIELGQDSPPGEVWAYNNAAIQTLSAVLTAATGEHPSDFARTHVFEPLGMSSSSLARDGAGNALMFMGLQTTCLDLARFGLLMANGGEWGENEVVSSDYVEQATATSSTDLNNGYGLLWWLNKPGRIASPALATTGAGDQNTREGPIVPGASANIFWALGFNNQTLAVLPDERIVAVRLGAKPPAATPFSQVELTRGVLDALASP